MIFLIASISYLISIHFLPNPYYALIIPIDIILWIYNWCKKRNYLSILDKELEKNSNNKVVLGAAATIIMGLLSTVVLLLLNLQAV